MPYAINLTLDPQSTLDIESVYVSLAALDIGDHDLITQYGACVTILVIADSVHSDDVQEALRRHVPRTWSFPIVFTEPCVIHGTPPSLSLRVGPTSPLFAVHHAIYRTMPEAAVHLHYRPAYWQPHLKLANVSPDQTINGHLRARMAETWQAMKGRVAGLEAIHYPPVEAIWQARLRAPRTHVDGVR